MILTRETSAGYMTNWAARLFTRELERQLAPTGIAPAYMPILFALAGGRVMTQKALAQRAAVEQPTMAQTLKRMERDGFAVRRPDPDDKRSALVSLTPKAAALIETVETVVTRINAVALAPLDGAERELFLALMHRIVGALEERDGQEPALGDGQEPALGDGESQP
jgi:MarR family transcriptional regulator for hemolysin